MLRKKHEGSGAFKRVTAVLLVLMLLMTLIAVGMVPIAVDAASAELSGGETITIYLQDSNWQGTDIRVQFLNSSGSKVGDPQTVTPYGNKVTVSGVSGATQFRIEKLNPTKNTYLNAMKNVVSGAGANQTVVFYDNTSTKWLDMKYYAWTKNSTTTYEDKPWNDRLSMTKVSVTANIYSAKINRNANLSVPYANIIFTGTLSGNVKQTADLSLEPSTVDTVKVYSSSENKWITYTDVERSLTAKVADRKDDNLNDLYITSKTTAKWSKYNSSTPTTMVYFKPNSGSWTTAYVHYDDSDDEPYYTSVEMTPYSSSPLIYQAEVFFGAMVSFSTGEDFDESDKKDQGSVFADLTEPVYVARDRSWTTVDNAMATDDRYSDFTVSKNNFATATPAGGSGKIIGFDATYYDYYSNNELTSGWRQNLDDGGHDDNNSSYRKQFSSLNDAVIGIAQSNTDWRYPMVFGDDYNASFFIDGYYNQISGTRSPSIDLDHFRAVNNSNFLDTGNELNRSIMGLVKDKLAGGDLMVTDTLKAPYFDNDWLSGNSDTSETEQKEVLYVLDNNNYGQQSIFANFWGNGVSININPEKVLDNVTIDNVTGTLYRYVVDTQYNSVQLSRYKDQYGSGQRFYECLNTLGSKTAVITTSGNEYNSSEYQSGIQNVTVTPTKRAMIIDSKFPFVETTDSSGVKHYVFNSGEDGTRNDNIAFSFNDSDPSSSTLSYYSGDGVKGKLDGNNGFFPFNSKGSTVRNYGFGMRVDMDFTLPTNGEFEDGSKALFNYSGDDDVWVFVDGNLILDIGGAHKPTKGSINFGYASGQICATTNKVCSQLSPGNKPWENGDSVTKYFNFNNTDPTKKHHMTVFYMERGTNDSNLMIEFSIQPVLNELDVYKEVQSENLNTGIDDEVMALAKNEVFDFTFNQDGSGYGGTSGKKFNYVHADDTTTTDTITNGAFSLKHYEEAMFNNDIDLTFGSEVYLGESTDNSLFSYDTAIEVKDILNGTELPVTDGSSTNFTFANSLNDPEERTLMIAEFVNTLKTASLELHKEVYKHNSNSLSTTAIPFEFTVELDLNKDGTYEKYPLEYKFKDDDTNTIYIAENGVVQMRQDQVIEFFGIPVGTPYRLTESKANGFEPKDEEYKALYQSDGKYPLEGEVVETSSVTFKNEEAPVNKSVTIKKTLDGSRYSGDNLFSFTNKLIMWDFGSGRVYVDQDYREMLSSYLINANTADDGSREMLDGIYTTDTQTTVSNGIVTFEPFNRVPSQEHSGVYLFEIKENKNDNQPKYSYDENVYYALIRIDEGTMDDPVYFTDADCSNEHKLNSAPTFVNTTKKGTITVTKKDADGEELEGTGFALIKVSSEADTKNPLNALSSEEINALVDAHGVTEVTENNGIARFSDLALYQEEGQYIYNTDTQKIEWSENVSGANKQTYCIFEYSPTEGYLPNYVKYFVVLADQTDYSMEFGYVDGLIVMPNASGPGMRTFTIIGLAILMCGAVIGAGYTVYRRRRPVYVGRHTKK